VHYFPSENASNNLQVNNFSALIIRRYQTTAHSHQPALIARTSAALSSTGITGSLRS
jgi:hypothetical protein